MLSSRSLLVLSSAPAVRYLIRTSQTAFVLNHTTRLSSPEGHVDGMGPLPKDR